MVYQTVAYALLGSGQAPTEVKIVSGLSVVESKQRINLSSSTNVTVRGPSRGLLLRKRSTTSDTDENTAA
jgi:hypothetical protein